MHGTRTGFAILLLTFALAAIGAARAGAADCFAPLQENLRWSCSAQLSTGETVSYCLNRVLGKGSGGDAERFEMVTTGPYLRTCSCAPKGKEPSFHASASYLCYDASTATSEIGKISKQKIVGETYNVTVNVRSTFKCKVDPACEVPQQ